MLATDFRGMSEFAHFKSACRTIGARNKKQNKTKNTINKKFEAKKFAFCRQKISTHDKKCSAN